MQTDTILVHLRHIPDYLSAQWSAHMGICIMFAVMYFVSLFATGNPGKLLRMIMTTLLVVYIAYGAYLRSNRFGYQIVLIGVIALFVMGVIRFIINTAESIRQDRIDAKLEEKALAMAEGRRGSFKSNVGGTANYTPSPDAVDNGLSREEIQDSIENQLRAAKARVDREEMTITEETATQVKHEAPSSSSWMSASIYADAENSEQPHDSVGTALNYDTVEDNDIPEGAFYARPQFNTQPSYALSNDDSYLDTSVMPPAEEIEAIYDALNKLGELRDMGILTESEFTQKKHELLARLG